MNEQTEERRGAHARQLLEDPLYVEAYKAIRERIVAQLCSADLPEDRRRQLNELLVALTLVQRWFEQVIATGTMAAMEMERKETLAQRVKRVMAA